MATLYPNVAAFTDLFRDRKAAFVLREIDKKIQDFCYSFVINSPNGCGSLFELAKNLSEEHISTEVFRHAPVARALKTGTR